MIFQKRNGEIFLSVDFTAMIGYPRRCRREKGINNERGKKSKLQGKGGKEKYQKKLKERFYSKTYPEFSSPVVYLRYKELKLATEY